MPISFGWGVRGREGDAQFRRFSGMSVSAIIGMLKHPNPASRRSSRCNRVEKGNHARF